MGLRVFAGDRGGGVALIAALLLPTLCLAAFGTVELVEVSRTRSQLQSFVDSAAMGGAKELQVDQSPATEQRTRNTADAFAERLRGRWTITSTATANVQEGSVTVTQNAVRPSFFGNLLPPGGFHLTVVAKATANSRVPLCVLATQTQNQQVLSLSGSAQITAPNCLVQSDSDIRASGGTRVQAGAARSVGAATGNISPAPLTDAPSVSDPFTSLPIETNPACTDRNLTLAMGTVRLNPGAHCGSIIMIGSGTLHLNPGEHYFMGGLFKALGTTRIEGTDVVVIFKNLSAAIFGGNTTLSLEGRKSGPFAGFVLITDRNYTGLLTIETQNAKKLLGTIYVPNATLVVSGNNVKVADQSPWTVIVAKRLQVNGSANLVINANYQSTAVPVPAGVGPSGVRLNQ